MRAARAERRRRRDFCVPFPRNATHKDRTHAYPLSAQCSRSPLRRFDGAGQACGTSANDEHVTAHLGTRLGPGLSLRLEFQGGKEVHRAAGARSAGDIRELVVNSLAVHTS